MKTFYKLLPTILIVLSASATAIAPQIQAVLAAHPATSSVLAGLVGIAAHWLPSPMSAPIGE